MKKTMVAYYSNNGSNRFLAQKIQQELNCKIEEIRPRIKAHILLLMGLSLGIKPFKNNIAGYHRVILVGPIWMGKFIAPLKNFVNKYKNQINELVFVTCCGSDFKMKDEKFGHGLVFKKVKSILNEKCTYCAALPITLVVPDDKKEDGKTVMNTRLSESNFKGEIQELFNDFMAEISQ